MSYCKVILLGNLTADAELRYTPSGKAISNFSVAYNRVWTSETGEKKEEVSFFNCNAFGRTAELICEYYRKGSPILLEGRLKQERFDDKETGAKRSVIKVIVESISFLPRNAGTDKGESASSPRERPADSARKQPPSDEYSPPPAKDDSESDVPF